MSDALNRKSARIHELLRERSSMSDRVTAISEALLHLLEVQTAPSFTKGDDHALYDIQAAEWLHAVEEARRVYRKHG